MNFQSNRYCWDRINISIVRYPRILYIYCPLSRRIFSFERIRSYSPLLIGPEIEANVPSGLLTYSVYGSVPDDTLQIYLQHTS